VRARRRLCRSRSRRCMGRSLRNVLRILPAANARKRWTWTLSTCRRSSHLCWLGLGSDKPFHQLMAPRVRPTAQVSGSAPEVVGGSRSAGSCDRSMKTCAAVSNQPAHSGRSALASDVLPCHHEAVTTVPADTVLARGYGALAVGNWPDAWRFRRGSSHRGIARSARRTRPFALVASRRA
jgi:hypothetical protein